ncbi:MAG: hypothetical protein P4M13_01890 [Alphaproteobacteria bacterium]|nr:hypothetical protein [Alphaproteobacteria bacterium]
MTENETPVPPVSAPQKCSRISRLARCFLGIVLAGVAFAVLLYAPRQPAVPVAQKAEEVAVLERRVDALESRLDALSAAAPVAPVAPQANAGDTAALSESVKNLETRTAQIEEQGKQDRQATQKFLAAAFAFLDLREAAQAGQAFAPQLATLRAAAGGDAVIEEQAAKLDPYAAQPVPTILQLREALTSAEKTVPVAAKVEAGAPWWMRIKMAFQSLISVRSLHETRFVALEKALDSGDAQAALAAVKELPQEAQESLAAWQEKLEARIAVDDALRVLSAHFTTTPASGGAS